uniref:Uncharacterized protein n=1 Tax=Amphimedon queenslandica TaxID=400682 RepID=A0A1X7SNS9_AMPQE
GGVAIVPLARGVVIPSLAPPT